MNEGKMRDKFFDIITEAMEEVRKIVPFEEQAENIILRVTRKDLRMFYALNVNESTLKGMFDVRVTYTRTEGEQTNIEYKSKESVFTHENGMETISYNRYRKEIDLGIEEEICL